MLKTIWISYDLGVKGDYPSLYRWLDNMKAVECGDSLAYVRVEIPQDQSIPDFIKNDLIEKVNFSRSDRVYIIWRHEDGFSKGRFIVGKRKASPWQGFGDVASGGDDL